MVFWIVASLITLAVAGLLTFALLKGGGASGQAGGLAGEKPPAAYDLQVYRDQLKEIDRDVARGVVAAEDADRVRAEVSRRILAADAQMQGADVGNARQSRIGSIVAAVLVTIVLLGGAMGAYWKLGAPGYADVPLEVRVQASKELHDTRPTQAEFEAKLPPQPVVTPNGQYAELITKLRQTVADRPDDLQGYTLLARNEANLGNDKAAYEAQTQVIRLKGIQVTPQDHLFLAEMMIAAAQGYVSPEAEAGLRAAMQLAPKDPIARYYWGLMLIQNDRPDLAFRIWVRLLRQGPDDAPWLIPIRARIEELAWLAGEDFQMPPVIMPPKSPALSGPSQSEVQAAGDLSSAEQQEMIRGMVATLAERLSTTGGSPREWARLIGAYGVLNQPDLGRAALADARLVFGDDPDALALLDASAAQAGIAE